MNELLVILVGKVPYLQHIPSSRRFAQGHMSYKHIHRLIPRGVHQYGGSQAYPLMLIFAIREIASQNDMIRF